VERNDTANAELSAEDLAWDKSPWDDDSHDAADSHGAQAHAAQAHPGASAAGQALKVLVYSDDRTVRQQVRTALGRRPAADLPVLQYVDVATEPVVISQADGGGFDLLILDGEATPAGGMGICRQLKDEIYNCPPILVLIGRPQDAWLATWSRADAVVAHPIDALVLADAVAGVLRERTALARS
jgi:DNA-binding response OmpR family regulator